MQARRWRLRGAGIVFLGQQGQGDQPGDAEEDEIHQVHGPVLRVHMAPLAGKRDRR
jgi:hypothetical protein